MTKRNLFAEISEGIEALAEHRAGKRTLRTHEVQDLPAPAIPASELIALRESLAASNLKCNTSPHVRCCSGRTTNNV
jgi:putative transcriptional regulator